MKQYGLIVIGAGITGLTTGVAWAAKADPTLGPVVVLEAGARVGGMVTSFRRDGYLFDTCQLTPDLSGLLKFLGIELEMVPLSQGIAKLVLVNPESGRTDDFLVRGPRDVLLQDLKARFPEEAGGLDKLFRHLGKVYQGLQTSPLRPGPMQKLGLLFHYPRLVTNAGRTLDQILDRYGLTEPTAREVFALFSDFCGLPGSRVAGLTPMAALFSVADGCFRPRQGFARLPGALRSRLLELGGELRCSSRVRRIIIEAGVATGVELECGEVLRGAQIVATVDPNLTFGSLIPRSYTEEHFPAWQARVDRAEMSLSSLSINLGLEPDFKPKFLERSCGYTLLTTGGDTAGRLYRSARDGLPGFTRDCFCVGISRSNPRIAAPGLTLRCQPFPLGDWEVLRRTDPDRYQARKQHWADFFVSLLETHLIPDLSRHIRTLDVSTPATFARYSGSPTGANYDMAAVPENFGLKRVPMVTPIEGLLQPKFFHGIMPCMQAGLQAVDYLLQGSLMSGKACLGQQSAQT